MNKDIEAVAAIYEEFRAHPSVRSEYFGINKGLIAASLTAAYFSKRPAELPRGVTTTKVKRDPGKKSS